LAFLRVPERERECERLFLAFLRVLERLRERERLFLAFLRVLERLRERERLAFLRVPERLREREAFFDFLPRGERDTIARRFGERADLDFVTRREEGMACRIVACTLLEGWRSWILAVLSRFFFSSDDVWQVGSPPVRARASNICHVRDFFHSHPLAPADRMSVAVAAASPPDAFEAVDAMTTLMPLSLLPDDTPGDVASSSPPPTSESLSAVPPLDESRRPETPPAIETIETAASPPPVAEAAAEPTVAPPDPPRETVDERPPSMPEAVVVEAAADAAEAVVEAAADASGASEDGGEREAGAPGEAASTPAEDVVEVEVPTTTEAETLDPNALARAYTMRELREFLKNRHLAHAGSKLQMATRLLDDGWRPPVAVTLTDD